MLTVVPSSLVGRNLPAKSADVQVLVDLAKSVPKIEIHAPELIMIPEFAASVTAWITGRLDCGAESWRTVNVCPEITSE